MAFCSKCGAQIDDNATFCPQCGAQVGAANTANNTNEAKFASSTTNEKVNAAVENVKQQFTNTKDHTEEFDAADIEANKVLAAIGYLGILFLVPLLAAPNSKFAKFHANQGLVLCIADFILGVLQLIPVIRIIADIVIGIPLFVMHIMGIVNTANGKAKELPFIGGIQIIK